ncbi:MAG: GNAT family N-acetyltransferase [Betaproteobacteria bacterium]|nr:GNAT family N-acetyltransferase [Betaproteobacteria bacterium]
MRLNPHGQPIGDALPDWKAPPRVSHTTLSGRYCRVEPLDAAKHAADLFAANALDTSGTGWTYLTVGPFSNAADYRAWADKVSVSDDPLFHAIFDLHTAKPVGVGAYMRIDAANGVVEIGNLRFSPLMQRTPVSTESMYLMMKHVFALGYRRYEWKCDTFNAPSRRAAQRFGFSYEGVFRQAVIYKQRTRDTAWYSIIDSDWPAIDAAFSEWLAPDNFDADGKQRVALSALTGPLLKAWG